MKLSALLERMSYTLLQGSLETDVTSLIYDSRKATSGSMFVCISGTVRDAHDFIPQVIEAGASALVVEREVSVPEGITVIRVDNARLALACLHPCTGVP